MTDTNEVIDLNKASQLVSIREACVALGIGETTGYRMLREGRFPLSTVTVGNRQKVSRKRLAEFIDGASNDELVGSA